MYVNDFMPKMCQYSLWPNCQNSCKFCLKKEHTFYTKDEQLKLINYIINNIDNIDWKNEFSYGISLLGGEIYYINDKDLQHAFLALIDKIIDKILLVSQNAYCKYSTVTNGIYDPSFLYTVIDKIIDKTNISKIDINFSYDLKYRYKNENDRCLVLKNINDFSQHYNYKVGVQMILTQNLINLWKSNCNIIDNILKDIGKNNNLQFLYPHPIMTGYKLDDFYFNRHDFLEFIRFLRNNYYDIYCSFILSTKNSSIFKYTGLKVRNKISDINDKSQPVLSDGKEILNPKCGHSVLYKCYADTDICMMCDIINFDSNAN